MIASTNFTSLLLFLQTISNGFNNETEKAFIRNYNDTKITFYEDLSNNNVDGLEIGNHIKVTRDVNTQNDENEVNATTIPKKERKNVKLNMKQGVLVNQIIATYSLAKSINELCRNHSLEFQLGFRAFEPWALQMFDSSSKLQSGILSGNLVEYGSFKQCIHIYHDYEYGPIIGKQCTVRVKPISSIVRKILAYRNISDKRYEKIKDNFKEASLYWSVCIPDSCQPEDVESHFSKTILSVTEGVEVNVTVNDFDCYSLSDVKDFSSIEKITLYSLGAFLCFIILCTFIDLRNRNEIDNHSKIIPIFSIYSNVSYLTSYKEDSAGLACLHGIRFFSMVYVVFGHRYLMSLFFPALNSLDILNWNLEYGSTLITGGTISVDSFFLISALLVSYNFFDYMSKGGKFNWFMYYLHRFLRLTPSFAMVILILVVFGHRFGSGILWKKISYVLVKPCQYFWWSALLHIQCFTNPKYMCVLQTWYLSCEMQFYIFAPVIMYPLWKSKMAGVINIVVIYVVAVAASFYIAWKRSYRADLMFDSNLAHSDFFINYYIQPYIRCPPYIMGLGFGYILFKTKDVKIKMGRFALWCGWITSISMLILVILSNHRFVQDSYDYDKLEVSFYLSMIRSAWVLALAWIIWACRAGQGGPINTLLSASVFQVFGKLAYSVFLVHMPIQFLSLGSSKHPIYFSNFECVEVAFGDVGLSLTVGFFLTILVEYPLVRTSLLLIKPRDKKVDTTKN